MTKQLTVRPDSVIARTAYLIDQRKQEIDKFTRFLNGDKILGWENVDREQIIIARAYARECLSDLMSDDYMKFIKMEFDKIREEYIKEDEHDVRRTV